MNASDAERADAAQADLDRERVADEQILLVWAHARLGSVIATLFAVVLAVKLRDDAVPAAWADGWLALKLAVGGWRTWLAWRHLERRDTGARWRTQTDAWLAVDGAVWGVAGFALVSGPVPVASLIGAVLVGISCAATFGLQVRANSTAAYVVPIVVPTAFGLLLRDDEFGWVGGLGLLLLLALQLATARRSERQLRDGMLLRLQAQALVREKDDALKLALRQSAVKTQFLANISHELRTPLHGILGLARLLQHDAHEPALLARVGLIEASGTHLLLLINDLLDISRIEAGRFVMRAEPFDLRAQIAQVAAVHALRAGEKGLAFECIDALPESCWVQGDAARFRQVLHNLLGNAIKFTEAGSVWLRVELAGADTVAAEVRDTGPGIRDEELAKIFDAFHQSTSAAAQAVEGAGLGLTIARDIAREMGGDIEVHSRFGAGTTLRFTAHLPAAAAPVEAPAVLPPASPAAAATPLTVLVAEDDDVNALIVLAYLTQLGADAARVPDGAAVLPLVLRAAGRPDLVLMDCRMPVLDGYAATRAIREQEREHGWPRLPIVALTATAGDTDRQQCLDAGMDDFLVKPYTREELAGMLARWGGRGQAAP